MHGHVKILRIIKALGAHFIFIRHSHLHRPLSFCLGSGKERIRSKNSADVMKQTFSNHQQYLWNSRICIATSSVWIWALYIQTWTFSLYLRRKLKHRELYQYKHKRLCTILDIWNATWSITMPGRRLKCHRYPSTDIQTAWRRHLNYRCPWRCRCSRKCRP